MTFNRTRRRATALLGAGLMGVAGLSLATPAQAAPQSLSVDAVADTYVTSVAPTNNYGTAPNGRASGSPEKTVFYKFDVGALPGGKGSTGSVTSATLKLHGINNSQTPGTVAVHDAGTGWDELAVTYDNQPTVRDQVDSGTMAASTAVDFDVTSVVSTDQNGLVAFAVKSNRSEDNAIATRENPTAAWHPELVVEYDDGVVVEPNVALTNPTEGQTVDGTVRFDVNADPEITGIDYLVDGVKVAHDYTPDGSGTGAGFGEDWNSTTTNDGGHTLIARAIYPDGTVDSAPVNFTVNNSGTPDPDPNPEPDGRLADAIAAVQAAEAHLQSNPEDLQGAKVDLEDALALVNDLIANPSDPGTDPGDPGETEDNAPTVNAGQDATVTLPDTHNLNGTVVDDGTFTSSWSKVSGPGTVNFSNPNRVDTEAAFSQDGTYVLQLTADDGVNAPVSDDVTVTVEPKPTDPVDPTPPTGNRTYGDDAVIYRPLPNNAPLVSSAAQSAFTQYVNQAEPKDWWTMRTTSAQYAANYGVADCNDPIFKIASNGRVLAGQEHLKTVGFHAPRSVFENMEQNSDAPITIIDKCGTSARPDGLSVWGANVKYNGSTTLVSGGDGTIVAGSFDHRTNGIDSRNSLSNAGNNVNIISRGVIPETIQATDEGIRAGLRGEYGGTVGHVLELFFVETSTPAGHTGFMVGDESGKAGCFSRTDICSEGQYVRINPNVNLENRTGCTGYALVLARTIQKYGAYFGNNSGSGSGIKQEAGTQYNNRDALKPCMTQDDLQVIEKGYIPPVQ